MKNVTTVITCDTCNTDISPKVTSFPRQDILRVECINVAQHKEYQMIYSVAMRPIIEQDLYFCGLECMKKYKEKKDYTPIKKVDYPVVGDPSDLYPPKIP